MVRLNIENEFHNDIKIILNHRIGSPYNMICMFLGGPFIIPLYDTLGNGIIDGLRILPTLDEFLVIETISFIILGIRLLRDYCMKKSIFPIKNEEKLYVFAINKLKTLKAKHKNDDNNYDNAINRLIERNKRMLNQKYIYLKNIEKDISSFYDLLKPYDKLEELKKRT